MNCSKLGVLAAALIAFAVTAPAAHAADDFFKGKTLKIVVPYGPGGTYDQYAFTFTKHMGKHIPGKPAIILQHMPGAGGSKAMNWAYNVMAADGYNMLIPLDNTVLNQLLLPNKMRYDARNFTWLGSSNQTNQVLIVRSDTGVRTWHDLLKRKSIASSAGASSFGHIVQTVMSNVLGFQMKNISGYKGSAASTFAVEQGESEMNCNNWLTYSSKVPQWFKGDKPFARAVLQLGVFADPEVPKSVPLLSTLVKDPMDKAAIAFMGVAGLLGRGLVLPPKAPGHAVTTLRASYDAMNADPDFAAALKKRSLRLIPSTGAEIQKIVNQAIDEAKPEVVARARMLIREKK